MSKSDDFLIILDEELESELDNNICNENCPWLDKSHPLYFPATNCDIVSRWDYLNIFSVEKWYDLFNEYTFDTVFIELSIENIKYLISDEANIQQHQILVDKINNCLNKFAVEDVFIRMSTRSPKDSEWLEQRIIDNMLKDQIFCANYNDKQQQIQAFVNSSLQSMKVNNADDIIEIIKQSPRIFNDLLVLLNAYSPGNINNKNTSNIIIRKWYNIKPELEFRVFVSKRFSKKYIITAICQYYHFVFFENIQFNDNEKKKIEELFCSFVSDILDPVITEYLQNCDYDIQEYIIDLCLIDMNELANDLLNKKYNITLNATMYAVVIIEINPFFPATTSCALFDWKKDLDMLWGENINYKLLYIRENIKEDFSSVSLLQYNYDQIIAETVRQLDDHT